MTSVLIFYFFASSWIYWLSYLNVFSDDEAILGSTIFFFSISSYSSSCFSSKNSGVIRIGLIFSSLPNSLSFFIHVCKCSIDLTYSVTLPLLFLISWSSMERKFIFLSFIGFSSPVILLWTKKLFFCYSTLSIICLMPSGSSFLNCNPILWRTKIRISILLSVKF